MRSRGKELRIKFLHGKCLSQGVLFITRCQTWQKLGNQALELQSVACNTASLHGKGVAEQDSGENVLEEG